MKQQMKLCITKNENGNVVAYVNERMPGEETVVKFRCETKTTEEAVEQAIDFIDKTYPHLKIKSGGVSK